MKDHTTAEIFEELWKRIEYDASVSEELASESNELQERIDKAIEYIEQKKLQPRLRTANTYSLQERQLLDILKGSDSNDR